MNNFRRIVKKKRRKPDLNKVKKSPTPINYEAAKALYNTPAYKEWRQYIFDRDLFRCQMCGQQGGSLEAHHIKRKIDRPDLVLNMKNGITLCKHCHQQIVTGSEKYFEYIFNQMVILNERRQESRNLQDRKYPRQESLHRELLSYSEAMDQARQRT